MKKGNLVLVPFPFTDLTSTKKQAGAGIVRQFWEDWE